MSRWRCYIKIAGLAIVRAEARSRASRPRTQRPACEFLAPIVASRSVMTVISPKLQPPSEHPARAP